MASNWRRYGPPIRTDKKCPVCQVSHRRVGPLCSKHESQMRRNGGIGAPLKGIDLDIYRPLVQTMLNRYADDDSNSGRAISGGLALMDDILKNYGKNCDHATVGRKCRPYVDKLVQLGATARSSFIECAAVYFLWEITGAQPSASEMDMQVATRLLLHKRTRHDCMKRSNWSRSVIGGLGYRIRCDLGTLFLQMARVCVKQDMARREAIRAASSFKG